MQNIINALLNTVLVSIPEETIIASLVLIFLKRFDLLDLRRWKRNIVLIGKIVLPASIILNIFRYLIIIPKPIVTLIGITTLMVSIYKVCKSSSYIKDNTLVRKVVLFNIVSLIIVMTIESLYLPFIMFILEKPIEYLMINTMYTFLLILPIRLLECMLVASIIIKQNKILHTKLFNYIFNNKTVLKIILVTLFILVIFMSYMTKLIVADQILNGLNTFQQIITTIFVLVIPVILIFIIGWLVNYFLLQITSQDKSHQNMFDDDI